MTGARLVIVRHAASGDAGRLTREDRYDVRPDIPRRSNKGAKPQTVAVPDGAKRWSTW